MDECSHEKTYRRVIMKKVVFDPHGKLSNEDWVLQNGVSNTYYLCDIVNNTISRLDLKDTDDELFKAMKEKLVCFLIELENILLYKPVKENRDVVCADLSALILYTAFNIKEYQFLTDIKELDEIGKKRLELLETEYLLKNKIENYNKSECYRKGGKIKAQKIHDKLKPVYEFILKQLETINYKSLNHTSNLIARRIREDKILFALVEDKNALESWVDDILKKWKKEGKIVLDKKLGVLLAQRPDNQNS